MEKITLCGDNCLECPRYLARTNSELEKVAELWFRVGWRDRIVPIDEIRCFGCTSHNGLITLTVIDHRYVTVGNK